MQANGPILDTCNRPKSHMCPNITSKLKKKVDNMPPQTRIANVYIKSYICCTCKKKKNGYYLEVISRYKQRWRKVVR